MHKMITLCIVLPLAFVCGNMFFFDNAPVASGALSSVSADSSASDSAMKEDVNVINALLVKYASLHNGNATFTQESAIKGIVSRSLGFVGLTPLTDKTNDNTEYGTKILDANNKALDIVIKLINSDYPHQSAKIIGCSKDGVFVYIQISVDEDHTLRHITKDADTDSAWHYAAKEIRALYDLPYSPDVSDKELYKFPLAIRTSTLRSFLEGYIQNEVHLYADLNAAKTKFDNADVTKN